MGWTARQEPSPQAGTAAGQKLLVKLRHCSFMSLTSRTVSLFDSTSLPADVHTHNATLGSTKV